MARKRSLSDPQDDSFTVVQKRKKGKSAPSSNLNHPKQGRQPSIPPKKAPQTTFNKFKVVVENKLHNYQFVQAMSKSQEDLNMLARPNLQGQWILTPKDHATYQFLTTQSPEVVELRPEQKLTKAIIYNYPLVMNLSPILNLQNTHEAVRQISKAGQYTTTVLITFLGAVPAKINLGIWGTFTTKTFHPQPLRCYNCQRYGHHKSQCTAQETCAVCSGRHSTAQCLKAFHEGKETRAKCPNCKGNHHAWNPRCPERLKRIPASKVSPQPTPKPRSKPTTPRQPPKPRSKAPQPKPQRQHWPKLRQTEAKKQTRRNAPITSPAALQREVHRVAPSTQATPAVMSVTYQEALPQATPQKQAYAESQVSGWWNPSPPRGEEQIIKYTESGLKTLLKIFAQSLAALMGAELPPNAVDDLLEGIPFHQAQAPTQALITATSTPVRRLNRTAELDKTYNPVLSIIPRTGVLELYSNILKS